MIESRQYTSYWDLLEIPYLKSLSTFWRRTAEELDYLVTPEDTTEQSESGMEQWLVLPPLQMRGVIKTLFWVVIALAITLLLGQLG